MFEGIKTDGPFGGGQGEQMFRSLMLDQYGKQIAERGGFGLSDAITRALLSHQEARPLSADAKIETVVKMAERLVAALQADIAALEGGRPRDMQTLDPEIQLLSAQYGREAASLNRAELEAAPAEQRARLTAVDPELPRGADPAWPHPDAHPQCQRRHDQGRGRRGRQAPQPRPALCRALWRHAGRATRRASSSLLYNAVV